MTEWRRHESMYCDILGSIQIDPVVHSIPAFRHVRHNGFVSIRPVATARIGRVGPFSLSHCRALIKKRNPLHVWQRLMQSMKNCSSAP
jgi:hypothetical protein